MRVRPKISDFSPLFEGLRRHFAELRIEDREGFSVLTIHGVEVIGPRPILEKVREGLNRNGGPHRLTGIYKNLNSYGKAKK